MTGTRQHCGLLTRLLCFSVFLLCLLPRCVSQSGLLHLASPPLLSPSPPLSASSALPNTVVDPGKSRLSLPSKGLRLWTFLENPSTVTVELHKGFDVTTRTPSDNFSDAPDIEFVLFDTDSADLLIKIGGVTVAQYTMSVGPITGSLDTDIPPARSNPAIPIDGYILSIGIMDAPAGMQHQLYVHMTLDQSNWMGNLPASTPFWALCLPGAHDAGMNTTQGLDMIVSNPALLAAAMDFLTGISDLGPIISDLVASNFERYAIWLGGLTQKDSVMTMLSMGVRYFDYRPGFSVDTLRAAGLTDIRHQHDFLPGARWVDSLTDILLFLTAHPSEIVEVSISSNGFAQSSMVPSAADLQNIMDQAMGTPGVDETIKTIGPEAFTQTLAQLRLSNSRLIVTDSNHGPTMNVLDAWNPTDWATLDPSTLEGAYQRTINASAQAGNQQTEFQIQGTATDFYIQNIDLAPSLVLASDQNLPLVQTKGQFDTTLLGFILGYQKSLDRQEHLTIIDDWVDGFMVSAAINITLQRIDILAAFVPG